ncbi:thiamine pyrophosphate-dependent enzyme [Rathayibacter soli]|uniref:thiamine pyrophosphate-dependent enzyme n=1 Tax=Rathayibacter soli TaxID=3144168 RepID=UPI0027E500DD|nr:thiamine pyrophosphate-dependent enzyme [Glaciibacter superstes]
MHATLSRTPEAAVAPAVSGDRLALLETLYERMLLARELDLESVAMQRQGIIPGYAPARGQEAAQVGSASALDRARDFAFPTYRELGVAVALGADLVGYLASHQGSWHGGMYDFAAARLAPINAVVGAPAPHAMGWALGEKLAGRSGASIAYFGDGASSQGDIHEAMNFAGVWNLPVVFFCQNNGWAISLPTSGQVAGGSVAARAAGYGMPGVRVNGNDVLAVYDEVTDALARARSGGGATVVEAMTYRIGPHSTSDDPGRYRSLAEEHDWQSRDPLVAAEARLRASGVADVVFDEVAACVRAEVERVRQGTIALKSRPTAEMFDFVFADPPAVFKAQRNAAIAEADDDY